MTTEPIDDTSLPEGDSAEGGGIGTPTFASSVLKSPGRWLSARCRHNAEVSGAGAMGGLPKSPTRCKESIGQPAGQAAQ
jgi:hypothetical protein